MSGKYKVAYCIFNIEKMLEHHHDLYLILGYKRACINGEECMIYEDSGEKVSHHDMCNLFEKGRDQIKEIFDQITILKNIDDPIFLSRLKLEGEIRDKYNEIEKLDAQLKPDGEINESKG